MGFLRPWYLLFLGPVILTVVWLFLAKSLPELHWPLAGIFLKQDYLSGHSFFACIKRSLLNVVGRKNLFQYFRFLLIAVIGISFVFLSAGLFKGEVVSYSKVRNYVIVLVQDRSGSMSKFFDVLGKVSETFMRFRGNDRFCGVYFSDTAVSTLCGESAKVITKVSNAELNKTFSSSMGGGTEIGLGLLKALNVILKEAGMFNEIERNMLLESLIKKELPVIAHDKKNSHSGYIAIVETDAEFPASESVSPVQVLTVMKDLGIRVYFLIFTKSSPEAVIRAVRNTGGQEYFIDPDFVSKSSAPEKELLSVFSDIDTLNPKELKVVTGVKPRTFARHFGALIVFLSVVYYFTYPVEELLWFLRSLKNRKKKGVTRD